MRRGKRHDGCTLCPGAAAPGRHRLGDPHPPDSVGEPRSRPVLEANPRDALFATPIFIPSEFYEQTGMPKKTANRLLQQLREQEIITVIAEGGGRRATTYVFSRLIAVTEGDRL